MTEVMTWILVKYVKCCSKHLTCDISIFKRAYKVVTVINIIPV